MQTDRFKILLERYLDGSLSPDEWDALSRQLSHRIHGSQLHRVIDQVLEDRRFAGMADQRRAHALFSDILSAASKEQGNNKQLPRMIPYRAPVAAAAALILLLAGGWLFYRHNEGGKAARLAVETTRPGVPGGHKAVLILSGGAAVVLDSAGNGKIASQGNTRVLKYNGLLSYRLQGAEAAPPKVLYNTVVTPRGGAYEVLLADSSKVWLNAASSLHFPTSFPGKSREVTLTGEAYFEITHHASQPFIVHISSAEGAPKGEVQVLGTHFNINAYDDESAIRTTLLGGKIRVTGGGGSIALSPGEEADLDKNGVLNLREKVDTQEAVAWKNGLFLFRNTDIRVVMRQVARWYDIEVNYAGNTEARLSGMISRNTQLTQVLRMLELTREVHFKTAGKIVTVMP
jgi:ferric-dicitrate binding protein FerR (iron transport regulator)